MKSGKLLVGAAFILVSVVSAFGQTQPNLENGFKPYGSYQGSNLDSINLMDSNILLHAPANPQAVQRGKLEPKLLLYLSSQNWTGKCDSSVQDGSPYNCYWAYGGTGISFEFTGEMSLHRQLVITSDPQGTEYSVGGYSLTTWDGAPHALQDLSTASQDIFETADGTAYHVVMSNPDQYGIHATATVTDGQGTQYTLHLATNHCTRGSIQPPYNPGGHSIIYDTFSSRPMVCEETLRMTQMVDSNGNQISGFDRTDAAIDTLGHPAWPVVSTPSSDSSGCVNTLPFANAVLLTYAGPSGVTNTIKVCNGTLNLQTFFGVANVAEIQNNVKGAPTTAQHVTTVILADGSKWVFSYDSYGNVTNMALPTGGSIAYTWTNFTAPLSSPCAKTPSKRVIQQRTLTDLNGSTASWSYQWGVVQSDGSLTSVVTDPRGNDAVHMFRQLIANGQGCPQYETTTLHYQGTRTSGTLLKREDTSYGRLQIADDGQVANPMPTDIKTTIYPSGKVSLVHKDYDSGLNNGVSYGRVTAVKEYEWGAGVPGPLLRETETTYQWQMDTSGVYKAAHLIDLPAAVVVKDGNGNRMAETDYLYDEAGYLTNAAITTQHGGPPASVRGNLTTVKKWLNTNNTWITSHTNWYDTGEVYQQLDPLGHTTTHSYDAAYAGAYSTKTCNALNQCVSGTYDLNTGLLTSFTDQNASSQASGNTQGDANHSSNYGYDLMSRLTSAQFPPDANGSRPQTTFTYSPPNVFPLNMQRQKSLTATMNYVSTAYFDGFGRGYRTQHASPSGNATMDTTYDGLGQVVQVTNPYFSATDATYGVVQTQYDGLGRATQTTEQDSSIVSVSYIDNCTISTDEAGKQRRGCSNALGQLTSVDEPGDSTAGASPVPNGGGSAATGWVSISGSEQSKVVEVPGGGGGGGQNCDPGVICDGGGGGGGGTTTIYDAGTVSLTVSGRVYTAQCGQSDTPNTIAVNLAAAVNQDPFAVVAAGASGATVNLASRATGSQVSYSLSASWTWDTADFTNPSFTAITSGSVSGGSDGPSIFGGHAYTTLYTYDALGNLLTVTQQGVPATRVNGGCGRLLTIRCPAC